MKRALTVLFACLCVSLLLAGCKVTKAEEQDEDALVLEVGDSADQGQDVQSDDASDEASGEASEEASDEAGSEEPASEELTWFDTAGITITPCGDISFETVACTVDASGAAAFTDEYGTVYANVQITASVVSGDDGDYQEVTATITAETHTPLSVEEALEEDGKGIGLATVTSAFDRNTGISFDNTGSGDVDTIGEGESAASDDVIYISYGGETYDITVTTENSNNGSEFTDSEVIVYMEDIITVRCPVEYDASNIIFQMGKCTAEMYAAEEALDYENNLYTADQLPYWGEGQYYFTITDS